jgi:hypothetical protein
MRNYTLLIKTMIAIVLALLIVGCGRSPTVTNEQLVIVAEACTVAGMEVRTRRWYGGGIESVGCVPSDKVPEAPVLRSVK